MADIYLQAKTISILGNPKKIFIWTYVFGPKTQVSINFVIFIRETVSHKVFTYFKLPISIKMGRMVRMEREFW